MKKLYFFIVVLFACGTLSAQTDLPNGQLENWYFVTNPVNPGVDYWEPGTGPTDNWLATLNSLAQIPSSLLGPGPITAEREDDAHSGTYAAKLKTEDMNLGVQTIIIPGMLGTATMVGMGAKLGRPSQAKPLAFKGYYKYEPVAGDSCTAVILVSKWNATTMKRDTIGFGAFISTDAVSTYTEFNVPVDYSYPAGQEIPDSMTVLTISSAGFNVYNFLACQGQVGSTMMVDDLVLLYPTGIEEQLMPSVTVKAYPNPATDMITFESSENLKNCTVQIFSAGGVMTEMLNFAGKSVSLNVGNMASGMYRFRIVSGKSIITGGSFTVIK